MTQATTRPVTFPCGEFTLEGILHLPGGTPAPAAVICHPSAQYGGDMYNHVVIALCDALTERGYVALRFNMQGVGASEGQMSHATGADDARAALAYVRTLREVDSDSIGLIGYSVGALAAAEAASSDLKALVLVAPPLGREDLRVDPGCPVLLIAGDHDEFAPVDRLELVGERTGVELQILEGGEHFWHGAQDRLKNPVGEFFAKHFV